MSTIKAALDGVESEADQFGPRDPMKDVLSKRALPCIVKLRADVIAMP
jgi:hypothetical protein